jgi:pyruvate dehydrogenase E1 component alpha subunit
MDINEMLKLYKQMLVLRYFDEMCTELKLKALIMDGFHPYVGQEAVAVGVCSALTDKDVVVSNHRPQGHAIAKGITPRRIFAEFMGRRGGVSQGIGGPMQFIDSQSYFFCGSIVGSGIPISTGFGLALKKESKGRVCVCFFGDGASNTGAFHEGLNLAALWKLPVVYICENNQYAEAMPVREFVSVYPISKRAESYGLEGITVDGNDLEAVVEASKKGIMKVRNGEGPVFIETITYRIRPHYIGDPEFMYRTKEEIESWKKKCPVERFKARLVGIGIDGKSLDIIEKEVISNLEKDKAWAIQQPFPSVTQATNHVIVPLDKN